MFFKLSAWGKFEQVKTVNDYIMCNDKSTWTVAYNVQVYSVYAEVSDWYKDQ